MDDNLIPITGEWIDLNSPYNWFKCSNCGCICSVFLQVDDITPYITKASYCPYCGVQMSNHFNTKIEGDN